MELEQLGLIYDASDLYSGSAQLNSRFCLFSP